MSSIMSVLLSLLFVYRFMNTRWVIMIDVILRKKTGRNEIHMIQLIGKMSAEFNTIMKHWSSLVYLPLTLSNSIPKGGMAGL